MFNVDCLMYSRLSSSHQHAASCTHTDYTNEAYIYVFNTCMCTGNSRLIGQNAAVHKTIYLELRTFCTDPLTHSVRHRAYINILGVKLTE